MARRVIRSLAILAIAVVGSLSLLIHTTTAKTLVVGDGLGWLVPPGGPLAYATWAVLHTFFVGDVLVFNFPTGLQDVAMVTKEAFLTCNATSPISLKTTGPANFTLDNVGDYYFICTMNEHCSLGQQLAIDVTAPGPTSSPAPYHHHPKLPGPDHPRGPVTFYVGDALGWLVPPGGPIFYTTWAYYRDFMVGDTLVFSFVNGTQDVALVTKAAYDACNTSSTITVWSSSAPVKVTLNSTGEYLFTCTFPSHCALGQKLAINVTAAATPPPSTTAKPPSISGSTPSEGPAAVGPSLLPVSSAPSCVGPAGFFIITLLSIIIVHMHKLLVTVFFPF